MIPKPQILRKAPLKGKRNVKQLKFKYSALQMFYNSFGYVDPHIGGFEYMIIKKDVEVRGRFKTILLNSNNLKEFSKCLTDLQQIIDFEQYIEMVRDCKILTEVILKIKSINNFKFNKILILLRVDLLK